LSLRDFRLRKEAKTIIKIETHWEEARPPKLPLTLSPLKNSKKNRPIPYIRR
jgi:hypothetical protein